MRTGLMTGRRFGQAFAAFVTGLSMAASAALAEPPAWAGGNKGDLADLLANIASASAEQRRKAADIFVEAASGAETGAMIDAALPALENPDPGQRYYALVGLGAAGLGSTENGEQLATVADSIVEALYDEDASVREAAAAALAAVQPAPPEWAAEPLLALLNDPEPRVVAAATAALERIAASYGAQGPVMFDALYAGNVGERRRAVRVLGAYAAQTGDDLAVWALVRALDDPEAAVRWQAATAIGSLGAPGAVAAWDLGAVSNDQDEEPRVRRAARRALNSVIN